IGRRVQLRLMVPPEAGRRGSPGRKERAARAENPGARCAAAGLSVGSPVGGVAPAPDYPPGRRGGGVLAAHGGLARIARVYPVGAVLYRTRHAIGPPASARGLAVLRRIPPGLEAGRPVQPYRSAFPLKGRR